MTDKTTQAGQAVLDFKKACAATRAATLNAEGQRGMAKLRDYERKVREVFGEALVDALSPDWHWMNLQPAVRLHYKGGIKILPPITVVAETLRGAVSLWIEKQDQLEADQLFVDEQDLARFIAKLDERPLPLVVTPTWYEMNVASRFGDHPEITSRWPDALEAYKARHAEQREQAREYTLEMIADAEQAKDPADLTELLEYLAHGLPDDYAKQIRDAAEVRYQQLQAAKQAAELELRLKVKRAELAAFHPFLVYHVYYQSGLAMEDGGYHPENKTIKSFRPMPDMANWWEKTDGQLVKLMHVAKIERIVVRRWEDCPVWDWIEDDEGLRYRVPPRGAIPFYDETVV